MKQIVLFLLLSLLLSADILKENYITIDIDQKKPTLLWDFESDNLEKLLPLDDNKNGIYSWKEIKNHKDEIIKYTLPHLQIKSDNKICKKNLTNFEVYRRVHQSYIKLYFDLSCTKPKNTLSVKYDLFFNIDSQQKVFIKMSDKNTTAPFILSPNKTSFKLNIKNQSFFELFKRFLVEGVLHIWHGIDHLLFLLMLILPSVYHYANKKLIPTNTFKEVFKNVLYIVTAFSIAHSITLSLSVLDIVTPSERFVETAIALSILFTALNNIVGIIRDKTWVLSFLFGLIHGFGFAFFLKELLLKSSSFASMLFGFNLGVEIGQIIVVSLTLPILFFLRKSNYYKTLGLYGISFLTVFISSYWAWERYFSF